MGFGVSEYIRMPQKKALQLFSMCGREFKAIADRLYFEYGKLQLSDPIDIASQTYQKVQKPKKRRIR